MKIHKKLEEIIEIYNLESTNNEPTRGENKLDFIFTTKRLKS